MAESSHVINQDALNAIVTTFETKVGEMFSNTGNDPLVNIFADTIPAGGKSAILAADDFVGQWEEWQGARVTGVSRAYVLRLELTRYTPPLLKIPRLDFQYDNIGLISSRVSRYLTQAQSYRDVIMHQALVGNAGAGPIGIDGVALFSASHPNGLNGATQSNLTTSALTQATFDAAYLAMNSYVREGGEPFGVTPRYLVVGPKLRKVGLEITGTDIRGAYVNNAGAETGTIVAAAGITNINNGVVTLIIDNRLSGVQDDYWYLVGDAPGGVKPLAWLEGMAPTSQINTDMNSDSVIMNDSFTFGLLADGQIGGYGWPSVYAGVL